MHAAVRRLSLLAACASSLFAATEAHAYCYSGFCPSEEIECFEEDGSCNAYLCTCVGVEDACTCTAGYFPDQPTACFPSLDFGRCKRLKWGGSCTGFAIQRDGLVSAEGLSAKELGAIVDQAFATWMNADCGNELKPGLFVQDMGTAACDRVQYNDSNENPGKGNANIVVARAPGDWPHAEGDHKIALTTTTYDPNTGELLNADIEINGDFFNDDPLQDVDLLGVLTHETGHFLGLGHSQVDDATMRPTNPADPLALRDLDADDRAAICNLYPPNRKIDETCNPLPKHGYSGECAASQIEGDCAIVAPRASDDARGGRVPRGISILGAALALTLVRRRLRART